MGHLTNLDTEELIEELLYRTKPAKTMVGVANYISKENLSKQIGISVSDILPHLQKDYLADIFELPYYADIDDFIEKLKEIIK